MSVLDEPEPDEDGLRHGSSTPIQELAKDQYHQDAKTANDLTRGAAQIAILINGGAATALLAYASNIAKSTSGDAASLGSTQQAPSYGSLPLNALPAALGLYAFGVFVGALSLWFLARCINMFMHHWLAKTLDGRDNLRHDRWGRFYGRLSIWSFVVSIGSFVVASGWIAERWYAALTIHTGSG